MPEAIKNDRAVGPGESGTTAQRADSFPMRLFGRLSQRCAISEDIWRRIGLLFSVLCLLKVVMLAGFRKYLFETYWRVGTPDFDWINYAAFFLFALLVCLNLWNLAKRYENTGPRTIRTINAFILVLGALFILLDFHEGNKNHLHSLMTGILGLKNLLPYYSLNLFFRPPYLAAWLGVYAAIYWIFVRTGREHLILRTTAVFVAAYILLCLRELCLYKDELMVANALGIAGLICARRYKSPLNLPWILLPVFCLGSLYLLFRQGEDMLPPLDPECAILTGVGVVLFIGAGLLAWRRGFYAGWSWLSTFAGLAFLLFVNANYPLAPNYQNAMCLGLTVPRYFIGEFGLALALLLGAACYRRWRPAGSLLWLDVSNIILIAVALVDLRLAQIMGARLDWDLLSLALGESPKMMWRMAQPYLPAVAGMLAGIVAVYTCALWGIGRLSRRTHGSSAARRFNAGYAVVVCILLGLAGRWTLGNDKVLGQTVEVLAQTSPLWRNTSNPVMEEKHFRESASRLGMEQLVAATPPPVSGQVVRDLNVVFIFLESTYNKHLSLFSGDQETQPLLSQYKERMELFPNFYSSFAGSINARFASLAGLYPGRDYKQFTSHRVEVKSLFELLHEQGYATSMFYSSFFDYTGFRDFLRGREVDEMFDAGNMPGAQKTNQVSWGLREEDVLAAMQRQIQKHAAANQKFFMTYVPAAPHNPYDGTPNRFRKFRSQKFHDFTPFYLNELLYMDWIITSVVEQLKESGLLDKTLIVITGDHGEMLGADGGHIGHGWALTPELANVPLIIMDPGKRGYQVNKTVGSQVDILPTILDTLGISCPPDQLYQGVSLYSTNARADRVIYLNTFRQYAVIQGHNLFFGDRDATGSGGDNRNKTFTMQNEGARTSFVEMQTPVVSPYSMSDFDAFQENFFHNYSHYRQMMRPTNAAPSSK